MPTIAISNIAWQIDEDAKIFEVLASLNIHNLEISPFRASADPFIISQEHARSFQNQLSFYGIQVIAVQALLFRHPELVIFKKKVTREKTMEHLVRVINFAHYVGAKTVIFGSPKNKCRGEMAYESALDLAVDFFGRLSRVSEEKGITFCLEPTPETFGADFIRNTKEAMEVIQAI